MHKLSRCPTHELYFLITTDNGDDVGFEHLARVPMSGPAGHLCTGFLTGLNPFCAPGKAIVLHFLL